MYTAAVLSQLSADLLKWIVRGTSDLEQWGFEFKTERGDPLPHHMTINLGDFDYSLNNGFTLLNCPVQLTVEEIVYNHVLGVCAAPVIKMVGLGDDEIKTVNAIPHITLCIKTGSKPVISNKMLETPSPHTRRRKLDKQYILEAIVEVVK